MVNLIRHFRKSPLGSILHIQVVPISVSNRGTILNNLFLQIFRNLKSNHPVWDTVISNLKHPTIWPINDQLDHQLTISGKMMIHPFKIVLLRFMIRLMALNDRSNVLRLKIVTSEKDLFCYLTFSNWIKGFIVSTMNISVCLGYFVTQRLFWEVFKFKAKKFNQELYFVLKWWIILLTYAFHYHKWRCENIQNERFLLQR